MLERLSRLLDKLAQWGVAACAMAMALVIGSQVAFRYGLNHSLFWSEELARLLLVWLTFLGASVAYKRGAHLGVDLVAARLPVAWRRWMDVLATLVCLALFLVMLVYGTRFALFIRLQQTTTLGVSRQIPFLMVPVSGGLLCVHALARLAELLRGGSRP